MGRHKRRYNEEINLTPLLDVLFTILFIVMLTSAVSQKSKESAYAAELSAQADNYQAQLEEARDGSGINELNEKIAKLEAQIEAMENAADGMELYEADVVIVTMENTERDDAHIITVYTGQNAEFYKDFKTGSGLSEYARDRVTDIISEIAEEASGRPVYVVFHCDKSIIRTAEWRAIEDALNGLKETYKEVFYQIVEE